MPDLTVSLIVIGVRLLTPFTLLRWPLGGVFVNMLTDFSDHIVLRNTAWGLFGNGHYQLIDKLLDTWYLFFLFILIRRWKNPLARRAGTMLFTWRFLGVVVFAFTDWRHVLVFAPNIVEYFYLVWVVIQKWFSGFKLTTKRLVVLVLIIGSLQTFHELIMHWWYPDIGTRQVIHEILKGK